MVLEQVEYRKFIFSGHDSFHCRKLWLKKGYDYVKSGNNFNSENAVIKLGVGKNMVSAIRFWLKAFKIIDAKDNVTKFGDKLLDNLNGYDPYLEDEASLWLLHYQLVVSNYSSIYNIIINEFRKEKLFFSKDIFINYIKRTSELKRDFPFNENTISKDFMVFTNLYKNNLESKDIEESYSGLLAELDFVKTIKRENDEHYHIENSERDNLNHAIFLFAILNNPKYGYSISLNALEFEFNSPGSVFALTRKGLLNKIYEIVEKYDNVSFTDHAGIKELQFKKKESPYSILDRYYDK